MKVFNLVLPVLLIAALAILTSCGIYETKGQNNNNVRSNGITLGEITPNTKLSYANIRDLVILPNCKTCHVDATRGAMSLKDYASVKANLNGIEATVFNNNPPMPPLPAAMPALGKAALRQWIVQGAPETVEGEVPTPSSSPSPTGTPVASPTPPLLIVSYAQVSAQVFSVSCKRCHMQGAARGNIALDTYAEVIQNLGAIKSTVFDGKPVRMPRNGLPEDQKFLLKTWIDLGAKEGVVIVPSPAPSATPVPSATPIPNATPNSPPPVLVATFTSLKANVFDAKCIVCHTAGGKASDFPLDRYASMLAASGFVVPGNVNGSSLVSEIAAGTMPPKRANLPAVTADELAVIKTWILNGAPE